MLPDVLVTSNSYPHFAYPVAGTDPNATLYGEKASVADDFCILVSGSADHEARSPRDFRHCHR